MSVVNEILSRINSMVFGIPNFYENNRKLAKILDEDKKNLGLIAVKLIYAVNNEDKEIIQKEYDNIYANIKDYKSNNHICKALALMQYSLTYYTNAHAYLTNMSSDIEDFFYWFLLSISSWMNLSEVSILKQDTEIKKLISTLNKTKSALNESLKKTDIHLQKQKKLNDQLKIDELNARIRTYNYYSSFITVLHNVLTLFFNIGNEINALNYSYSNYTILKRKFFSLEEIKNSIKPNINNVMKVDNKLFTIIDQEEILRANNELSKGTINYLEYLEIDIPSDLKKTIKKSEELVDLKQLEADILKSKEQKQKIDILDGKFNTQFKEFKKTKKTQIDFVLKSFPFLKDYTLGFISEFSIAFNIAQAISSGSFELKEKDTAVSLVSMGISFIPLLGDTASKVFDYTNDYISSIKLKAQSKNISLFGVNSSIFDSVAEFISANIILDAKCNLAIENYGDVEAQNFTDKINEVIKIVEEYKKDFDDGIMKDYSRLSSKYQILGHEDAKKIIEMYLISGEILKEEESQQLTILTNFSKVYVASQWEARLFKNKGNIDSSKMLNIKENELKAFRKNSKSCGCGCNIF